MANHTLAAYCIAMKAKGHHDIPWDANALSNCVKDLWKTAKVTVIRIEVLVVLSTISLLFMATFGSWRRQSRNSFIQNGVLVTYTLSSSLTSYTLGSMHSSVVKSSMYPIWVISLYLLFGCADSITARSLNDNDHPTNQLTLFVLFQIYTLLIVGYDSTLAFWVATLAFFKFMQRFWAYHLASSSWNLNKMVADYMYEEHSRSGPSYNPTNMNGYHYLVDWPLDESKLGARIYATELAADGAQVIDTERIWLCSGLSPELKDVCLSFSLFHLLRRRFFGFVCAESSQQKTHDFVFKGLLSKNEDGTFNYNRIFKVIEVELAFCMIFFFTKYAVIYYGSKTVPTIWSLASATLMSLIAYQLIATVVSKQSGSDFMHTTTYDVIVTILILSSIALLEFLQVFLYWSTNWGRVSFVCHYVREQAVNTRGRIHTKLFQKICCMRLKEIILNKIVGVSTSRSSECYYQNNLGQYSLLESASCNYKHSPSMVRLHRFMRQKCSILLHPDFGYLCGSGMNEDIIHARCIRKGHGKPTVVKLPSEVKEALVDSLQLTQGVLASGESSLVYNKVHDLLWACKHNMISDSGISCYQDMENHTHIILTWHIATSYCEMATLKRISPRVGGELKLHLGIATILSKYCAYLVVSAPKLLPGHHYDTSLLFDAVSLEAARFLWNVEDKYEALRSLTEFTETSIFRKGVKLGRQLEGMEDDKCWKVLADFWAEMLLYISPSDNVKEHIECLANGGEFITHLWALLSHAGILQRGQRNVVDIENCVQPSGMVQQQANIVQNVESDGEMEFHVQGDVTESGQSVRCTLANFTGGTSQIGGSFRASGVEGDFAKECTDSRMIEEIENAGTDSSYPGEISYSAAFRSGHVRSSLDKCREGSAPASCSTNQPATCGNCVQPLQVPVEGGSTARAEEMIRSRAKRLKWSSS